MYQDYFHRIANVCATVLNIFSDEIISNNTCQMSKTKMSKMLNFIWNTSKHWWNETDDDILPVFTQFLWALIMFPWLSMGTCFWRYSVWQIFIYLAIRKFEKHCNIIKIIQVQSFCSLNVKTDVSISYRMSC